MWKQVVAGGLSLIVLVGCDNAEKADVKSASAATEGQQAEQQENMTAIYFSEGVGIDFGRKPVSDSLAEISAGKHRVVKYEFDEGHDVVDKTVSSVLESYGFKKEVRSVEGDLINAVYVKKGEASILTRYRKVVREGFVKKTLLVVSWLS